MPIKRGSGNAALGSSESSGRATSKPSGQAGSIGGSVNLPRRSNSGSPRTPRTPPQPNTGVIIGRTAGSGHPVTAQQPGSPTRGSPPPPRRTRSWTPPQQVKSPSPSRGSSPKCESLLPPSWKKLVSAAYCEETGRPICDRVRLIECSSGNGRRQDPCVFWLHTLVRWADLRITHKGRRPERGEDLTLFVLHAQRDPLPSRTAAAARRECSSQGQERRSSPNKKPTSPRQWVVTQVRVLSSPTYVEKGPSTAIGKVGGSLLRLALSGPLVEEAETSTGPSVSVSRSVTPPPSAAASPARRATPAGTPAPPGGPPLGLTGFGKSSSLFSSINLQRCIVAQYSAR